MVYKVHNARANYRNADAAGDDKMKHDILMSELAKLIVSNPKRVMEHLQESGVKVNGTPGTKKLARIVSYSLSNSPKFAGFIASDIASGKPAEYGCDGCKHSFSGCPPGFTQNSSGFCIKNKSGQTSAADGDAGEKVDVGAVAGAASTLVDAFGKIFGGKKRKKDKAAADKAAAAAEKELVKQTTAVEGKSTKSNIGRNIAIGVGVAILVGGVVWVVYRARK